MFKNICVKLGFLQTDDYIQDVSEGMVNISRGGTTVYSVSSYISDYGDLAFVYSLQNNHPTVTLPFDPKEMDWGCWCLNILYLSLGSGRLAIDHPSLSNPKWLHQSYLRISKI